MRRTALYSLIPSVIFLIFGLLIPVTFDPVSCSIVAVAVYSACRIFSNNKLCFLIFSLIFSLIFTAFVFVIFDHRYYSLIDAVYAFYEAWVIPLAIFLDLVIYLIYRLIKKKRQDSPSLQNAEGEPDVAENQ